MFGFLFLYKTSFIAVFFDPFSLGAFFCSIPPRPNVFLSEQEDDLPAEVVSEGLTIKQLCHLFVSVSSWPVSGILLQPFWAVPMTCNKLEISCSGAPGMALVGGCSLTASGLCCQPHSTNPMLNIQVTRWHYLGLC